MRSSISLMRRRRMFSTLRCRMGKRNKASKVSVGQASASHSKSARAVVECRLPGLEPSSLTNSPGTASRSAISLPSFVNCAIFAQPFISKSVKEIALRLAVPGELVSELGSRPGRLHSTTALALFECEALAWPTETFDALLRFPILQRNVENILRRRIKEMEDRICRVTNQGAEHRVASELV